MIPTLGNGTLFILNRDRPWLELTAKRKRKAFILTLLLFTVVTAGVMAWILQ